MNGIENREPGAEGRESELVVYDETEQPLFRRPDVLSPAPEDDPGVVIDRSDHPSRGGESRRTSSRFFTACIGAATRPISAAGACATC